MLFGAGNGSAYPHFIINTELEFQHFPPPSPYIITISGSFLTVLKAFADFFSCKYGAIVIRERFFLAFPGSKQVGISSFYHFYGISNFHPLIFFNP